MPYPSNLVPSPFQGRVPESIPETDYIDVNGRAIPLYVVGVEEEYRAFRTSVGVIDFSMLYKWELKGSGAKDALNRVFSRNVSEIESGQIAYGVVVDENGMMIDDCTVLVYSDKHVRLTGGNPAIEGRLRAVMSTNQTIVELRDDIATLSVQGPKSRKLLQSISQSNWSNDVFPYYTFQTGMDVAGIPAHVNRMGFTAELGFEVMVDTDRALELWDVVMEAGKTFDIRPCAANALMLVRVEAGMIMAGLEYDESVSPYECRMGWAVDLDKGDFLGKDSLVRLKGNQRSTIVSIVIDGDAEGLDGQKIFVGETEVGHVTMAVSSPALDGRTLALARVKRANTSVGNELIVQGSQGLRYAQVVATPVYDPDRLRVRM